MVETFLKFFKKALSLNLAGFTRLAETFDLPKSKSSETSKWYQREMILWKLIKQSEKEFFSAGVR